MSNSLVTLDRSTKFLLVVLLLLVSLASLRTIPVIEPWGADMMNLHLFHGCSAGRSPYEVTGVACGDPWQRDMFYPPLLYHSFAWVRPLKLETVMWIWTVFQLAVLAIASHVWTKRLASGERRDDDWQIVLFAGLLLLQYPAVFALERGGQDVVSVLLVTAAAALLARSRHAAAGLCLGLATGYKLYPLFCCAVLTLGLAIGDFAVEPRKPWRWRSLRLGAAALAAFVLANLAFHDDARRYFLEVLPRFSGSLTTPAAFSHSLPSLVGAGYRNFAWLLFAPILGLWVWAAARALARKDVAGAAAGALALSTYAQGTSYDYNLITAYPLLLVMFLRARDDDRWGVLVLGLIAVVGERAIYAPNSMVFTPALHVALQLGFLALSAIVVATTPPRAVQPLAEAGFSSSQS